MNLSIADGILWAIMVGFGETYFLADGVRLGGSPLELGLLVTLPLFVGAIGPVVALSALARSRGRKPIVVIAAVAQAGVLVTLALTDRAGAITPQRLIVLAALYSACGQTAGTAWSSWYGDLVPEEIRGRYFAQRNRLVHVAMFAALIAAGLLLAALEPDAAGSVISGEGGRGYQIIFAVAAGFRLLSAITLALSPEPAFAGVLGAREALATFRDREHQGVRRLLGLTFALQFSVYFASPYFGPFMLERLDLTYVEYTAGTAAAVAIKFVALPAWGRVVDHLRARSVYALAVVLVALVPLPWLFATGVGWVIVAQICSGLAWGGHELSFFALLLESSDRRIRPHLFAGVAAVAGSAQLLASLAGGWLLALVARDFRILFAASMGIRLVIAATVPWVVRGGPAERVGRRRVLLRLMGISPSGGASHRPVALHDNRDG